MASLERRERSVGPPAEEGEEVEEKWSDGRFVEGLGVVDDADAWGGKIVEQVAEESDGGGDG